MEYSEVIKLIKRILKMMKIMKMNFPERCEAPFRYNKILIIVSFLFAIIMQFACNNSAPKYTDTPTSGVVKIAVDETLAPILDSEISTFMALYKARKIIAKYEQIGRAHV